MPERDDYAPQDDLVLRMDSDEDAAAWDAIRRDWEREQMDRADAHSQQGEL